MGGRVYTYIPGTSTPKATYTDSAGATPNTNPVVLNARGEAAIYWDGSYDCVLKDASDVTIWGPERLFAPDLADWVTEADLASTASVGLGDALVGVKRTASGAIATTQHAWHEWQSINVKDFGAVGDGSTDDTSAINLAETAAFAAAVPLVFQAGLTYVFDGAFQPRITVYGWGATIKQKKTTVQPTDTPGTVHLESTTDVAIYGLTVDGNNKWAGITANGCTRLRLGFTTAKNCLIFGHAVLASTDVEIISCASRTIAYRQTGVAGLSADGFYHQACTNVRYAQCVASDFRRIGFASEGTATKSDFVKYVNCDASNGNNCDDSTTEYNSGFWHENTDNIEYANCTVRLMAGNTGQTSARVRGFVAAVGSSRICQQSYINCEGDGGSGNLPIVFYCEGTSQRPTVNYVNCQARTCLSGVACAGGVDVLRIKNLQIDAITAGASNGGVLFDIAGSAVNIIDIDGISVTNGSFNADSGWVVFFTGNTSTVYNLRNMQGGTHVMHNQVNRLTVDDSTVSYGSATYSSFIASTELRFKGGFRGSLRGGATNNLLVSTQSMSSGADIYFEPGSQLIESSYFQQAIGGTVNIWAVGAKFKNVGFSIQLSGSFTTKFVGCDIEGADATHGFIESSATAFTRWELLFTGNRCTGGIPLVKVTNNPTYSILHDNTHVNATLHSFTAGVTAANNVNTP